MKKILFVIARYNDHRQQIFEEKISPINQAYCEKHGFKYVEIKNDVNLQLFRNHPTWWKFTIVRDLINSGKVSDGDVIAHLDADMVIANDQYSIEPKKSFAYSICSGNTHCMGWYAMRVNDWSKQLIQNILSDERYQKLNDKITIHDHFKTYSSFWHDFREQASWYSLAGIKRHSDKPFWEYPNNGFHSEKNEDTLYSIEELEQNVELFPTVWNVTELEGETACQFNINKVKREEVILRHFAGGQPWLVDDWKKTPTMKIQAFLAMKNDFKKLDFTLSNFCKHNPDIPILVLNAGGESPEHITRNYPSVTLKHCEDLWAKPSFSPKFADYFFEYGLNKNFTHTILLETDVLTNRKITKIPKYDISGCLNYGGSSEIYNFLNIKENQFHTGCGGTIFSFNYFKTIKENNYDVFKIIFEKFPNEYYMDLMLTLAARVNNLTFGDWEEISNVTGHLKKINNNYQNVPCNYNATMIHHYKISEVENKSKGYLCLALGKKYIDQAIKLVKTLRKNNDKKPVSIVTLKEDISFCKDLNIFDKVIEYDMNTNIFEKCQTSFEKYGLYAKITMNKYFVYDENMIIDCDMLCMYSTENLWNFVSNQPQDIILVGLKNDPSWHWGFWEEICKKNNLHMPHISTGFVYARKNSKKVEDFFRYTVEAFENYENLNFLPWYAGGKVEEPCFAYGAAKTNIQPLDFYEFPIMTFEVFEKDEIPCNKQKVYDKFITLNNYIPFNHTFRRIDDPEYNAVFDKIMNI